MGNSLGERGMEALLRLSGNDTQVEAAASILQIERSMQLTRPLPGQSLPCL